MDGNYNLLLDTPLLCLSGEESYIVQLCGMQGTQAAN